MTLWHSNIKIKSGTLLELSQKSKFKERKKEKEKRKRRQNFPTAGDRTWVIIDQQDNHYTTPTADLVCEINYLYMHTCLLWETSVATSNNCFQR